MRQTTCPAGYVHVEYVPGPWIARAVQRADAGCLFNACRLHSDGKSYIESQRVPTHSEVHAWRLASELNHRHYAAAGNDVPGTMSKFVWTSALNV